MKCFVYGGGAREHALVWKLRQSKALTEVYAWPGNALANSDAKIAEIPSSSSDDTVINWIEANGIDLVVVGPEGPLDSGFADACHEREIKCFGHKRNAAKLESSKSFAKEVMQAADIPTASYEIVRSKKECDERSNVLLQQDGGVVIKASGLAGGKGVFVCRSEDDINNGIDRLFGSMKSASEEIVLESILEGRECSYFCMLGNGQVTPIGFAVDFKRLRDRDEGPNTGGMGCYTPVPWLPKDAQHVVHARIVDPLIVELKDRGIDCCGFLYVGLMWGTQGPQVVEFNVRLGDPEAQIMAACSDIDWGSMMLSHVGKGGSSDPQRVDRAGKCAVCVVMASAGYPYGEGEKDSAEFCRQMLDGDHSSMVFGASVKDGKEGAILTGKGRVLSVIGLGDTIQSARNASYERVNRIAGVWESAQWRRDIAERASSEIQVGVR